jgi:hypothetical protein
MPLHDSWLWFIKSPNRLNVESLPSPLLVGDEIGDDEDEDEADDGDDKDIGDEVADDEHASLKS